MAVQSISKAAVIKELSIYQRGHAQTPWVVADNDGPVYYRETFHSAMETMEQMKAGRGIKSLCVELEPL